MYVPINIKTNNYLLYSMIDVKQLVKKAKENNLTSLTITDNNMYGVIDFYKECVNNNIKPIIGLDIEKILFYAMNYNGYKNLIKLSTYLSERKITYEDIKQYSSDLLCIIPFEKQEYYDKLKNNFKNIFISYKNEEEKNLIKQDKIYAREILCIEKEDEKYLKYLKAIKEGISASKIKNIENVSLFPIVEEDNSIIERLCNLEIPFHMDLMPKIEDSYQILKNNCVEGLKSIFGTTAPKMYIDRLKHELEVINKMGFCDYFLIVSDYIKFAKDHDILVGPGRGSAAGSVVAYLTNITTIDPIKNNLLFERFLNEQRVTMPDIDVDFEDDKRDEVIKYCMEKYGIKKVAPIITFGTLGPRQVVRDVGKAMDISSKKIDILCKMIDPKISLIENYKTRKIIEFLNINSELKYVYKVSLKLEGLKRHTSVHAAGVVMSNVDLDEVIPLNKNHNFYTTGYDMTYLEEIGLLKMDFLGLKTLSLISNILKDIKDLSFDSIKENDKEALKIFYTANTVGIFQFESNGMINFLKKLKVTSFTDITNALALFRPGPMKNIDTYIKRKQGKEKINYLHPSLEEILKPTYGIIVYQEQIMSIASIMAGYSMQEADILRRAMSKKKESVLLKEKDKFISGSVNRGYSYNTALEVYNLILKFADYGFNKSHSVAYASIAYKMAYLKAHYPFIFMKNLLSSAINSSEKTKEYIYECKKNKIDISFPDINISTNNYVIYDNKIVYPLTNIKGIGNIAVNLILEKRTSHFTDIFDFVRKCFTGAVNNKVLENLIYAGAFDNLGYNRKTLINNLDIITNYASLGELFEDVLKPELTYFDEFNTYEIMEKELELFGFYLTTHPVTKYKSDDSISLNNLDSYFDKNIKVIIYVDKVKTIHTKKGDDMMFITAVDELASADFVLFPKTYMKYKASKGDILEVYGRVEKRFDKLQVIVNSLKKLK